VSAIVGFVIQAAMLTHENVPVTQSQLVSLLALASGAAGAKLWYALLHPGPLRQALLGGWALDGLLFIAPPVAVAGLLALQLPIGSFLDGSAPALFVGLGIARIGCFFVGCCAGRLTRSRWGCGARIAEWVAVASRPSSWNRWPA
jgi:phosphatidylglycerol:prolipoprotein diacylglycerol transferase